MQSLLKGFHKPCFAGKAYIDPSNVLLDGSMQWLPLKVKSDQKLYQDYPRVAKKSNQGTDISTFLRLLEFSISKISFRTFSD